MLRRAAVRCLATSTAAPASNVVSIPLFYNDIYHVKLPSTSSFPMEKYRFVREALQRETAVSKLAMFYESPLASLRDLTTVHTEEYVRRFLSNELSRDENRRIGFPWTEQSRDRALSSTGGTIAATHAVCQGAHSGSGPLYGGHIAGGTHHAFADRGEGYCVFNDIAVAAGVALRDYPETVRKILVVDLDVHQGNGCARIFADDERVVTYSQHCERNLFSARETSDFDIDVPDGAGDDDYLLLLNEHLPPVFASTKPDLVFFQAGVDPHLDDRIGRLQLTTAGLKKRNAIVYELAAKHACRLVLTMGGGYPRDLDPSSAPFHRVIQAHMDCYRMCMTAHAKLMRSAE